VSSERPAACPKCGMALESAAPLRRSATIYSCPMHPEIEQAEPGSCPICGMALEPTTVSAEEEENPELVDMTRRFWVGVVFGLPLVIIAYRPSTSCCRPGSGLGSSLSWRARSSSGRAGLSSSGPGSPWSTAASICSP
jgi:hypothetical protein